MPDETISVEAILERTLARELPFSESAAVQRLHDGLLAGPWRVALRSERGAEKIFGLQRPAEPISGRERAVLGAAAASLSNKVVAIELGMSASSASEAFRGALAKLGFESRAEFWKLSETLRAGSGVRVA